MSSSTINTQVESTSNKRLKLALKVLSSWYDPTVEVSDHEIVTLKSYLRRDVAGLSIDDLAGEVIQQELKIARDKTKRESA
jgi:hypothetical protein